MPIKTTTIDTTAEDAYLVGLAKAFDITDESKIPKGDEANDLVGSSASCIWHSRPPSNEEFFTHWVREPLYPKQQGFVDDVFGIDPLIWDNKYDEGHAFWGKGAGKDRTIAKLLALVNVKLLHMWNPQRGLSTFIGEDGFVGDDSPIDIVNVSKDRDQARDVFFKNFKIMIKRCKNPKTSHNFFQEMGMDIREGYDIQTNLVNFPHEITCHSLNSKQYAGEGLNLFLVIADEIGASPALQVRNQLTSIRETLDSRFPYVGKLLLMSFKYAENCAMSVEYKLGENNPRIVSSNLSCWAVNPKKKKFHYKRHYIRNPEKAVWTYECKETPSGSGGYIRQKYLIPWNFSENINPFIDNVTTTDHILSVNFKPDFFDRLKGKFCAIHVDLAKGKAQEGGDCVGISMVHPEMIQPKIHPKSVELLKKLGFIVKEEDNIPRKGVIIDFILQIIALGGGEIQFADIITFIKTLKQHRVNIYKVTYDGWQSVGEIQRLTTLGIFAEELSVDKTTAPYDTTKDLLYLGLLRGYEHSITIREFQELIKNDKGKIDHPDVSWRRLEEEGYEKGSKDCSDSIVGASYTAMKDIAVQSGIVW